MFARGRGEEIHQPLLEKRDDCGVHQEQRCPVPICKRHVNTYGLVGEKPVTIKEWVKKMSKNKEWGDSFCLLLAASWWSCRIGVVRSDCLEVITYRNRGAG